MTSLLKRIVLALWRPLERRAARAYLAGPALADALDVGERLAGLGYRVVLGYWNPDGQAPELVAGESLAALDAMRARGWAPHLSVKAPALRFDAGLVRRVVEAARGGIVHFDSHEPDTADATLGLAAEARGTSARVGVTIPGRWPRSPADAERAAEQGIRVRVVKGEWADPGAPHADVRDGFLAVVDRLAGRATHVSVATHDATLAREAIRRLAATRTPHDVELLVGLPFAPVVEVARAAGVPVRVYVPYGHASLRYGLAFLARNPRRVWWLVRDLALRRRGDPPALA